MGRGPPGDAGGDRHAPGPRAGRSPRARRPVRVADVSLRRDRVSAARAGPPGGAGLGDGLRGLCRGEAPQRVGAAGGSACRGLGVSGRLAPRKRVYKYIAAVSISTCDDLWRAPEAFSGAVCWAVAGSRKLYGVDGV